MPFKPRIIIILTKHTYPSHPLIPTFAPAFNLYKLETLPAHIDPEHTYSYKPKMLSEHIDPKYIPKPTSEHTTPLSHWKMVNCTLNKNEYRSTLQSSYHTLIFIAILTNNWYTIFYKRNHHHS